jgi:TolB-like protein/DNA-binding SARP family transcriptional activator
MPESPHLALLGGFSLADANGRPCPIPSTKARALLAVLALSPNGSSTHEALSALLWSDRGEAQARDSLKHALADLKARLAAASIPGLDIQRRGIRLDPALIETDVSAFLNAARDNAPDLERALMLYPGDLLEGTNVRDAAFEDWLGFERRRLRDLAESTAARLIETSLANGDDKRAYAAAQRLAQLDPLREDAARAIMRHHASNGERAAALKVYDTLARRLAEDLQTKPDAATNELARQIRDRATLPAINPRPETPALVLPALPSIAVLPFRNLGGNEDQDYFADGVAEDIIALLSHYRWFFVISRNSSFAFRDRTVGLGHIAKELGVRYILDGSVRRVGDRIRLTAELIEAATGVAIWSDRYERNLADLLALQDELARQVVGAIEPEILRGESNRAHVKGALNLDAYDFHMRGVWHHNRQDQPEDFDQSIRLQRKAVGLDPGMARAWMILSRSLYARALHGFSTDLEADRLDLLEAATRAVSLEGHDAYAHYAMSIAHLMDNQPAAAVIEAERAVELAPSFALAQNALGWSRIFTGAYSAALEPINLAIRLSPRDPVIYFFHCALALAHFHLGDHDSCVALARRAVSAKPRYFSMIVLLAGLARLDRLTEARQIAASARLTQPHDRDGYWLRMFPYADIKSRTEVEHALVAAGFW